MRAVPEALSRQLGAEAAELAGLCASTERTMTDAILTTSTDRFERRLSDEMSKMRLDLRDQKAELLKWSFLFWAGQVATIAALFRLTGR
jgi:hypothetical protein